MNRKTRVVKDIMPCHTTGAGIYSVDHVKPRGIQQRVMLFQLGEPGIEQILHEATF